MNIFLMHVGNPGNMDLEYTVTQTRTIQDLLINLPTDSPEKTYFENDKFRKQFPEGTFNCWGVPIRAKSSFENTNIGDVVLFCPEIGDLGGISQICIVKEKCPIEAYNASRILWPDTPDERLFPWLFFFNTETGFIPWYTFLSEIDIVSNWNPRGWYRKIKETRFEKWITPEGYLNHIRKDYHFSFTVNDTGLKKSEVELANEDLEFILGKRLGTQQGFSQSIKTRRLIEQYAMDKAIEYFENHGWVVRDDSKNKPYDLLCKKRDEVLYVEVKGTTTFGEQILLTPNEVNNAKLNHPNVALFILSQIKVEKEGEDDFIVSEGTSRLIQPWEIIESRLNPISYSYSVI